MTRHALGASMARISDKAVRMCRLIERKKKKEKERGRRGEHSPRTDPADRRKMGWAKHRAATIRGYKCTHARHATMRPVRGWTHAPAPSAERELGLDNTDTVPAVGTAGSDDSLRRNWAPPIIVRRDGKKRVCHLEEPL